jgi:hypothetical protein
MRIFLALLAAAAAACHHSPDCGPCPSGSTCGSANGIAVCRAASGVPLFKHVFVIVMENTSQKTLRDSSGTPYLHSLMASAASAADYHGVTHPSLPNYLALTSGGTQNVTCDCNPSGTACASDCSQSCACSRTALHLGTQLETAGKDWRAYGEDMGAPCNLSTSGKYAARHVPFLYYDDVQSAAARCRDHVVDFGSTFAADLASGPRALSFIAPNLTDDMHDPFGGSQNLANGDAWLSLTIPTIQSSAAYKDRGALFIVWDEDDLSGIGAPDDPVPLLVLSPLAKSGGYQSAARADHYSLLATIEDGLNLGRLGSAVGAAPLVDYFPAE